MNFSNATYEEVNEVIEKLLEIDSTNLAHESIRGNRISSELNKIYIQVSRELMKVTDQKNAVELQRYKYYSGKLPAEAYRKEPLDTAVLKTDIPSYMSNDKVVIEIRNIYKEKEMIVKLVEDARSSLKSRTYDIKNSIEFTKFMSGN